MNKFAPLAHFIAACVVVYVGSTLLNAFFIAWLVLIFISAAASLAVTALHFERGVLEITTSESLNSFVFNALTTALLFNMSPAYGVAFTISAVITTFVGIQLATVVIYDESN